MSRTQSKQKILLSGQSSKNPSVRALNTETANAGIVMGSVPLPVPPYTAPPNDCVPPNIVPSNVAPTDTAQCATPITNNSRSTERQCEQKSRQDPANAPVTPVPRKAMT